MVLKRIVKNLLCSLLGAVVDPAQNLILMMNFMIIVHNVCIF